MTDHTHAQRDTRPVAILCGDGVELTVATRRAEVIIKLRSSSSVVAAELTRAQAEDLIAAIRRAM